MKQTASHLIVLYLLLCPFISFSQQGRTLDSLQLVSLYNSTCNQGCTLNWDFSQSIDTWEGVVLVNDRVKEILLQSKGLNGNIPDLQLPYLTFLHLRENSLTGSVPDFTNMGNLRWLSLGGNQLIDTVPNFTNFPNLIGLYLWENNLTGEIPNFNNLPNLRYIQLQNNQLQGTIPNFTNLPKLKDLVLSWNFLEGEVPIFDSLPELTELYIFDNNLVGALPDFSHLDNLEILDLSSNGLTGRIPNYNNPKLTTIDISGNEISGQIPNFNLPNLTVIDFDFNNLSGFIPDFDSTNLRLIYLASNELTGHIHSFDNLPNLESLTLYSNKLSGIIPNFNLPYLKTLYLYGNRLSGQIPDFENLDSLKYLYLNENKLSDTIPKFNLPNLETLRLQGNELTGSMPEFNNMPKLKTLDVSYNKLSGTIPKLAALFNLNKLYLRNNKFSFDDIEYAKTNHGHLTFFNYSPQFHGTIQSNLVQIGNSIILRLSDTLSGNNNDNILYQWKQNDNILQGNIDSTYTIDSLQLHQVGKYTLHMTDTTRVSDLEIISEPIYVYVKGYDLYGEPVVYNQLMLEFQSREEKNDYENEFLFPNAGILADSCSCNRLFYLWEFPNDTIALQVLLDVSTKTQNQSGKAKVNGGLNNKFQLSLSAPGVGWTWSENYDENYPDSVLVYVLDSGLDTMGWEADKYLIANAPIDTCHNIFDFGYNYADTLTSITKGAPDEIGHGTFGVRSITEGLPDDINIKIVPLKLFDNIGQATLFNFICGLYHAIDHDANIINISAGYSGEPSNILEDAIALAQEKNQHIVVAAGNDGKNNDSTPHYPGYYAGPFYKKDEFGQGEWVHYDNVRSVASISPKDVLSDFSNYGKNRVTLAAYGEDMAGYSTMGKNISLSGSSVATFYVTKQLAVEIAKNKNRTYRTIWQNFETSSLRDCPSITELTRTGKCLDINLNEVYGDFKVLLEGAYDTLNQNMQATLNTERYILPGQFNNTMFDHTTATQPYNIAPFHYSGKEAVPNSFENYPTGVVDWILLSLRTDITSETEVVRTAAWVTKNGRIQLLKPLFDAIPTVYDSVYVVIEHRNHMAVMSPEKIPIAGNIISWDFTQQDSYTGEDTGTGQIQLHPNVWTMITGDGSQINDNGYDINADDKAIWQSYNGNFGKYLPADYNMDGDINGADKIFWQRNNGKFSSVPR